LNYVRSFVRHAGPGEKFIYWGRGRKGGGAQEKEKEIKDSPQRRRDAKSDAYPNVLARNYCEYEPVRFVPEMLRVAWHAWRHRREIESDADALFFQTSEAMLPWVCGRKRKPAVLIIHGGNENIHTFLPWPWVRFYRMCDRLAIARADRVIVVSRQSIDYYARTYPRHATKMTFLPTFADDSIVPRESAAEARRALGIEGPPDRRVACFIGRLHPPKRLDLVIDSFAAVVRTKAAGGAGAGAAAEFPDALLCIAGDGPLLGEVRQRIERLGLGGEGGAAAPVRLMGVLGRREVGLLFRASDASFMLTDWEGTPLSLLESLACGTPVIGSDVADFRHIIQTGKNGFLVDNSNSPEAIGGRLAEIFAGRKVFAREAARTGAEYLASRAAPRVMEVIRNAAENYHKGTKTQR